MFHHEKTKGEDRLYNYSFMNHVNTNNTHTLRAYGSSACPLHEAAPGGTGPIHLCIHSTASSGVQP